MKRRVNQFFSDRDDEKFEYLHQTSLTTSAFDIGRTLQKMHTAKVHKNKKSLAYEYLCMTFWTIHYQFVNLNSVLSENSKMKHQFCSILILLAVIHCISAKNLEGSIDQDSDAKLGSRDARIFGVRFSRFFVKFQLSQSKYFRRLQHPHLYCQLQLLVILPRLLSLQHVQDEEDL